MRNCFSWQGKVFFQISGEIKKNSRKCMDSSDKFNPNARTQLKVWNMLLRISRGTNLEVWRNPAQVGGISAHWVDSSLSK